MDGQIGLEDTPDTWCARLVEVFREVRRVLRDDGTVWLNVGDAYNAYNGGAGPSSQLSKTQSAARPKLATGHGLQCKSLKPKDLLGLPWMLAFALRADGWYLRSEIIWCLSGGTRVYARTQKGEMPITIKDLVRLDPATVQLWNGEKWTQVLGWSETPRPARTYEIELRSGERIGCTAGHLWPTQRGNMRADELTPGDIVKTCKLPEPMEPRMPCMLPDAGIGWLVGLYLAEGCKAKSGKAINISSHVDEHQRFRDLAQIADWYGGSFFVHAGKGNACAALLTSRTIVGIIDTYVSGYGAAKKHLSVKCWARSNDFLRSVLQGYLDGDGHFDEENRRWRVGFTNNDALAADLRTLCARLGVSLRLRRCQHTLGDRAYPGWRGEIRFERSDHWSCKDNGEIIAIRESRARKFWHIGVADEPHLFALASGVLTHNSKPSPMPESVRDRPTKAHEQVFLLSKQARYFYDAEAIREPYVYGRDDHRNVDSPPDGQTPNGSPHTGLRRTDHKRKRGVPPRHAQYETSDQSGLDLVGRGGGRNARTVWTIPSEPFSAAHFATFPSELARRCILAGTSAKGCCPACGAPWARMLDKQSIIDERPMTTGAAKKADLGEMARTTPQGRACGSVQTETIGWRPICACDAGDPVSCTVLDPFGGAGTTGLAAEQLGRDAVLIEINPEYAQMARERIDGWRARRMIGDVDRRSPALPGQLELLA